VYCVLHAEKEYQMLGFLANFISIKFPVPWRALVKVKIYKKPNQYTFVIFTSFNRLFLRIGYAKSRKILISQAPTLTLCFCLSFCPVSLTYWLLLALNLFWVAWVVSWIRCLPIKECALLKYIISYSKTFVWLCHHYEIGGSGGIWMIYRRRRR